MADVGYCYCLGRGARRQLSAYEVVYLAVRYAVRFSFLMRSGGLFYYGSELMVCRKLHSLERETGQIKTKTTRYDELCGLGSGGKGTGYVPRQRQVEN
jgi:hypothetical protein